MARGGRRRGGLFAQRVTRGGGRHLARRRQRARVAEVAGAGRRGARTRPPLAAVLAVVMG